MKTKQLTQLELATLAASLPTGTAVERVTLAFEIWKESNPAKVELVFYRDRMDARNTEAEKASRVLISPLSKALETILPDDHAAVRLDKWERFRKWQHENGMDAPSFDDDNRIGVFFYLGLFDELKAWELDQKQEIFSNKSLAMHLGKHGEKWANDALGDGRPKVFGKLVSNTVKKTRGNNEKAEERVQSLIKCGLLVKTDSTHYGIPKKSELAETPVKQGKWRKKTN